jgi:hypothetical protein
LSAVAILLAIGCQKPTINFDQSFINTNPTNVIVIDSITTQLSTIQLDSFNTTGSGTLLIGRYADPDFGVISAQAYLQIGPPTNLPILSNLDGFDSLVLILRPNHSFYGDTSQVQRYSVSQLDTIIALQPTQFAFYNISSFPYDSTAPLGFADAYIAPSVPYTSQLNNDSLKIRLNDNLGQSLFEMLETQSDTLKNLSQFISYFKGLVLSPGATSVGGIYGFRDSVILRLYYHEPSATELPLYTDFGINNVQNQFNHIGWNRSNTPLAVLDSILHNSRDTTVFPVPSTRTALAGYVQPATGVMMKIQFPYLYAIPQLPDFLSVLKATLIIRPVIASYSRLLYLPGSLTLYQTDQNNGLGPAISGNGNLAVDYAYGANTAYTYDVTSYIKNQIVAGPINDAYDGLLVTMAAPKNDTTFARGIIGDMLNPQTNIQLKLYYASYFTK